MILTYTECIDRYGNSYQLEKAVAEEQIYRVESGLYSTKRYSAELEIIVKKYPNAILTGEYAFYCHELTNVIPEKYYIATKAKAAKLLDTRIVQVYVRDDLYKEIIGNYRKIIEELQIWRIQEYADIFPKSKMIKKALEEEVF